MTPVRALVLILDLAGVGLVVAAATIAFGVGAGLAAAGTCCLVGALYLDVVAAARRGRKE